MRRAKLFSLLAVTWSTGCLSSSTQAWIDEGLNTRLVRTRTESSRANTELPLDLSGPVDRETIMRLVVARDPELTALAYRVRAMFHAARAEGSLPPPEANVQIWNLPLTRPYALGEADMYMLEVRQMFPSPGVLDARARAAVEEAHEMLAELSTREREVVQRAGEAWADYVGATLQRRVRQAQLALLEEMHQVAQARYAAGGTPLGDILRIQSEQARERRALARIDGELQRARAALNALLLRPATAPLGLPSTLEPFTVRLSLDELNARAERTRGVLSQGYARLRAAHARTEAARREATWPSFMVALSYWQDPHERPGIGSMATMSLPWIWNGLRERVAEAEAREQAERASVQEILASVRREVATAHARLQALEQELSVLRREARPAAFRALDATRAAYVAGMSDLLAWLDAARSVLDVSMEEAEITADLERTVTELEWAVGTSLPRVSLGTPGSQQEVGP